MDQPFFILLFFFYTCSFSTLAVNLRSIDPQSGVQPNAEEQVNNEDAVEENGEVPVEPNSGVAVEGNSEGPVAGNGQGFVDGDGEAPVEGNGYFEGDGEEPMEDDGEGRVEEGDEGPMESDMESDGESPVPAVIAEPADGANQIQHPKKHPNQKATNKRSPKVQNNIHHNSQKPIMGSFNSHAQNNFQRNGWNNGWYGGQNGGQNGWGMHQNWGPFVQNPAAWYMPPGWNYGWNMPLPTLGFQPPQPPQPPELFQPLQPPQTLQPPQPLQPHQPHLPSIWSGLERFFRHEDKTPKLDGSHQLTEFIVDGIIDVLKWVSRGLQGKGDWDEPEAKSVRRNSHRHRVLNQRPHHFSKPHAASLINERPYVPPVIPGQTHVVVPSEQSSGFAPPQFMMDPDNEPPLSSMSAAARAQQSAAMAVEIAETFPSERTEIAAEEAQRAADFAQSAISPDFDYR